MLFQILLCIQRDLTGIKAHWNRFEFTNSPNTVDASAVTGRNWPPTLIDGHVNTDPRRENRAATRDSEAELGQ